MAMFSSFSLPLFRRPKLPDSKLADGEENNSSSSSRRSRQPISLPPARFQAIETCADRRARTAKHLIKLNHANHALFKGQRKHFNQCSQVIYIL